MRIHYLMHVPFEGLGSMEPWFVARGHSISRTRLFAGEALPDAGMVDWLVVMGGPMSVNDEAAHPWLVDEKRFIETCVRRGAPTLGICLGGQLIASVLGARVTRNREPEIGWFPVALTSQGAGLDLLRGWSGRFEAYHWHGETFDIPSGAAHAASSDACANQAFVYGDRVVGLQFHLETQPSGVADLCAHCADELVAAPHVQSAAEMLGRHEHFRTIRVLSDRLLERLEKLAGC